MLVYKRKVLDVEMKVEEESKEELKKVAILSPSLARFIEADNKAYEEEKKVQKNQK
jgi:hypothetical protein